MAHFAEIINGIVNRVVVVNNSVITVDGIEVEAIGAAFCHDLFGGEWVQTSYNHNFRKNYAGYGFTYDTVRDAFIGAQPHASWILDEATCRWQPPVPVPVPPPGEGGEWIWDEDTLSWTKLTPP